MEYILPFRCADNNYADTLHISRKGVFIMEFNSTNELLKSNAEAMQFFNSLNADTQQQILDKYTGVTNIQELKTFAEVIEKHI